MNPYKIAGIAGMILLAIATSLFTQNISHGSPFENGLDNRFDRFYSQPQQTIPTETPRPTRRPTNTPAPSNTPTSVPGTPTNTATPGPTSTPTNTPLPTNTPTPTFTPTPVPICAGMAQEAENANLFGDMAVSDATTASGGQFVSIPTEGNFYGEVTSISHRLDFCIIVPQDGTYQIATWAFAEKGTDNSFFVTVNKSNDPTNPAAFSIESERWELPLSQLSAENEPVFEKLYVFPSQVDANGIYLGPATEPLQLGLTQGIHFISFRAREDGAMIDRMELELVNTSIEPTPTPTITPTPLPIVCESGLRQEAEDANLYGDMVSSPFENAGGGTIVSAPNQNGVDSFYSESSSVRHRIDFCFEVADSGLYNVAAWALAESGTDNSFFVTVNKPSDPGDPASFSLPSEIWELEVTVPDPLVPTVFEKAYVRRTIIDGTGEIIGPEENPMVVPLPAGQHIISFRAREDGAMLDRIRLERIGDLPTAEQSIFLPMIQR